MTEGDIMAEELELLHDLTEEAERLPEEAVVIRKPQDPYQASREARTEAIGSLLAEAYKQASNLRLTPDEITALRKPFTNDQVLSGAKGDPKLLYIQHIHLSDRLNDVIGVGQWAIIRRSEKIDPTGHVYVDAALLIRGALVAEAIGAAKYHATNARMDYSDAVESALSDALTRCCKRLGIGSQVWNKGFCESWFAERANGGKKEKAEPDPQSEPVLDPNMKWLDIAKTFSKSLSKEDYWNPLGSRGYGTAKEVTKREDQQAILADWQKGMS